MGPETLEPFVQAAEISGRGVVVLVRNSNPGAAVFQHQITKDGHMLFEVVAASLLDFEERLRGPVTGWSSLAVTAAATSPGDTEILRELLPHSIFLTLGYGSQGGTADDAIRGFVPGPSGKEGGIVNCSRKLLYPDGCEAAGATAWKRTMMQALDAVCDELRSAVS